MHFRFKPRRNPGSQSQHRSVNRTAVTAIIEVSPSRRNDLNAVGGRTVFPRLNSGRRSRTLRRPRGRQGEGIPLLSSIFGIDGGPAVVPGPTGKGILMTSTRSKGLICVFNEAPWPWPLSYERNRLRGEVRVDLVLYRVGSSGGQGVVERARAIWNAPRAAATACLRTWCRRRRPSPFSAKRYRRRGTRTPICAASTVTMPRRAIPSWTRTEISACISTTDH